VRPGSPSPDLGGPFLRRDDCREAPRSGPRFRGYCDRCGPNQGSAPRSDLFTEICVPGAQEPCQQEPAVSLTAEQFRYAFGNAIDPAESDELHTKWAIPAPGKPLFQAAAANLSVHSEAKVDTDNPDRGPLLLIMGGQDHTVPEAITKSTFKQYRQSSAVTDMLEFPDRGHSLVIDRGWPTVAEACLEWLSKKGL